LELFLLLALGIEVGSPRLVSEDSVTDLDDFDIRILEILAREGRITWSQLADEIGLSLTPTIKRVRALETEGYIAGYHATIAEARVGCGISVFVSVSLSSQTDEALASFEDRICELPEVMNCFMMTGETDYLLRVVVGDLDAYQGFISSLTRIPGVSRVTSGFAVKPVIQRAAPPLSALQKPRAKVGVGRKG
jgi:DNA-binding Lrp family transcriptional regulator